jgi:hypothetical protein
MRLCAGKLTGPKQLLRYDYADSGIPEEARTFVVVPTIWGRVSDVQENLERLELHYLANRDDQVCFALLADYRDADTEVLLADAELRSAAIAGVQRLNARYPVPAGAVPRFQLFLRARRWNAVDRIYMGWERKRGKLAEFAALLRGAQETSFA